jgi:signal transduction histidine kinase
VNPIPKALSVFSRFKLAGASVIIGVGIIGAIFYTSISNQFLGAILSRTLGPYSDTLAEHGFASRDPDIWRRMAAKHEVEILVEPADSAPLAFDSQGRLASPASIRSDNILSVRTGPNGTRVTFSWTLLSFHNGHLPLLGGLFVMIGAVVGAAFWFLHRQLKPLAELHNGVEAVGRGDFTTPVPVIRDDEIGQVAEAFNLMARRVGEMIDDRERLLADVSHELRSPIARMKVALEFVPPGDKRDALNRDLREMETLIAVLLERQELRSRTGQFEGEEVHLEALAGEVVSGFTDQVPGIELLFDEPVAIQADRALMKLLIQNLVGNALKFSRSDSQPVVVRLESTESNVILLVADDGIGIAEGDEERVFEPFVKLDRARGHSVGYGVGLNLCRRIVQLHGGTIELRPGTPRGTEAIVTFAAQPVTA